MVQMKKRKKTEVRGKCRRTCSDEGWIGWLMRTMAKKAAKVAEGEKQGQMQMQMQVWVE